MNTKRRPLPLQSLFFLIALMALAAFIKFRHNPTEAYLLMGSDGPYSALQIRGLVENSRLAFPDMPLFFVLGAGLAKIFIWLHLASTNESVLIALRWLDALIPVLVAIPIYFICREAENKTRSYFLFTFLIVAYALFNFTPLVYFSYQLQKNASAVPLAFSYLYFMYRILKYEEKRDFIWATLFLVLTLLLHFGSFALLIFFTVVIVLVRMMVVGRKTSRPAVAPYFLVGTILLVLLIALIDSARFLRLVAIPAKIFEMPVILVNANGKNLILQGMRLWHLIAIHLFAGYALLLFIRNWKKTEPANRVMGMAMIVLALFCASPLLGLEWANRLYMMSYIPITILYAILFNLPLSPWLKRIPAAFFLVLIMQSTGVAWLQPRLMSISREAYRELDSLKNRSVLSPSATVSARQDLRLLASWIFHTRGVADYKITPTDFRLPGGLYVLTQIAGSHLPKDRMREVEIHEGFEDIFQGSYFRLYKLTSSAGWRFGKSEPPRAVGNVVSVGQNQFLLSAGMERIVEYSSTTEMKFLQPGDSIRPQMKVEVYGSWQPFSTCVTADLIYELPGDSP